MIIKTLADIDLTKYKIADFNGAMNHEGTHYAIMEMAEKNIESIELPELRIALIPKNKKLTECDGDDWNDAPAYCNASGFYHYPEGTIFLSGKLGQELELQGKKSK